jgi:hypothetical protein
VGAQKLKNTFIELRIGQWQQREKMQDTDMQRKRLINHMHRIIPLIFMNHSTINQRKMAPRP